MMKLKKMHGNKVQKWFFLIFVLSFSSISAQESSEEVKAASSKYMQEAEAALAENNFAQAEALYRKAIAKNPEDAKAKYNLGNLYYNKKIVQEAAERHSQAATSTANESLKHKAFHNKGNAFMEQKQYEKAIEAYKNALRNDPEDDETRYNLALAKKMLEEQKKKGGGGKDQNKDQNQNQNQDKQQKDQQQKDQGNKGDKKESEDGTPQDKKPGEDKKEGEKEKDEKGQPKNEGKSENKPEKGEQQPKQQQPVPGQLSPQQIKNLLEAMANEEKKVQEKINAKKTKGSRVKTEKDW